MESKEQEPEPERGGRARRTYASLACCAGFKSYDGTASETTPEGERRLISICPGAERTYWRHVGTGRWNSKDAQYEKVEP